MECKEAQIISIAHIMGDLAFGSEQYQELDAHLASCRACDEEYKSSEWAIKYIEEHKAEFAEVFGALDRQKAVEQEEIERSWRRIEVRLDELEAQERKETQARFHRLLVRVSAVAACFAIGVFTWTVFSIHSKAKIATRPAFQQVALAAKPSVKIELVSENGNILIGSNQQIISGDELKTLVINDKHRVMMNTNTILAVEPLVENSNIGCLVKLDSGRIYTHVEHDGNPFVVDTAHGRVVITGTTFDIKATDTGTTLVVVEGAVQFGSVKDSVKVTAGQTSKVVGQLAPSSPASCNAAELTAWATGYDPERVLAEAKSDYDTSGFAWPWPNDKEPPGLENIDYDHWVKEKRNWFKQQFPHIFQLQGALAKEGIAVDYPELLIKSGDIWQFVYTKTTPQRFSVPGFGSLLKTVCGYGFDERWLIDNVPLAKDEVEQPVLLKNSLTTLKAFEQWQSCIMNAVKSSEGLGFDTQSHLFQGSVYLTETRSLIWFAVRDGKYNLTDKDRSEVLVLLQQEVNAAGICRNNVLYQPYKNILSCDPEICKTDKWCQWVDVIIKNINTITSVEEKITEYEISK